MSMNKWKPHKLSEIGSVVGGATPSTTVDAYYNGDIPWLTPKDLSDFHERYIERGERNITKSGLNSCSAQLLPAGSVLFSSRAPIGYVAIAKNPIATNQGFKSIIPNPEKVDSLFLYYLLKYNKDNIEAMGSGTTFKEVSGATMKNIEVYLPEDLDEQRRIAEILGSLDDKIELNRRINANLEAQAQALFRSWFVDFEPFRDGPFVDSELGKIPQGWKVGAASEFYKNITIGKTPPRKEHQWFSKESHDIVWVSIADMGNCGLSICNSSEYLTPEAIKKFNICIVPVNTVLLSFKLTIGRVAIADKELATNEAIAHFQTQHNTLEYTYLALKNYEFSSLGSTSSIATAVNSKIIKSMPWMMPSDDVLNQFHNVLSPIFNGIRNNIQEITRLSALRDTLLPKLMAGEF